MGAGKSSVGKRLAERLGVRFVDADREIEAAAGCTVADFFETFGEAEFRRGEERVIARLLDGPPRAIAAGGGAFMSARTRAAIREAAVSVWLRADLDTLFERVSRRSDRPLLRTPDPRATLEALIAERYPVYAEADLTVSSRDGPIERTVALVVEALEGWAAGRGGAEAAP